MKRLKFNKANDAGVKMSKVFKIADGEYQALIHTEGSPRGVVKDLIRNEDLYTVIGDNEAKVQKSLKRVLVDLGVAFDGETRAERT